MTQSINLNISTLWRKVASMLNPLTRLIAKYFISETCNLLILYLVVEYENVWRNGFSLRRPHCLTFESIWHKGGRKWPLLCCLQQKYKCLLRWKLLTFKGAPFPTNSKYHLPFLESWSLLYFFFFFLSFKFTLDAVKMKRIRVTTGEVFLGQSRTPTLGTPESACCNQEMRGGGRSFSPSYSSPTPTHHPNHHHHKNDSNRLLILSSKWLIKAFQSSSSPVLSANIIPTALCLIAPRRVSIITT